MYERIKQLTNQRNMTIAYLCKKTGIARPSLENTKKHDIGFSKMEKIADALDISLDEFRNRKGVR